ncbi:hypothetical protein CAPTEDRAFT_212226 [Capitella teleta]|uniref:Uncharacterized protein n=1 Tax=Capitella teleta TaxID=283909 RepID=R7UI26_CAPTE|nr:hypothetical protein CAPTEDRAFT_212226 [Capitella teleta]|eukprot:ELU06209.1 hypothetical protein CAPTEDRAFT_212226 [Capitella teleta]
MGARISLLIRCRGNQQKAESHAGRHLAPCGKNGCPKVTLNVRVRRRFVDISKKVGWREETLTYSRSGHVGTTWWKWTVKDAIIFTSLHTKDVNAIAALTFRQRKQKLQHDRSAEALSTLNPGDDVWVHLGKTWRPAQAIRRDVTPGPIGLI